MSEYRDPRIDPRAGDILRIDGFAVEVVGVDARVEARDTANNEWGMPLDEWRETARAAVVLWQDDAPPPADVALLASANRALAEQVERAERERDEARRVLLAIAKAVYGHPYRYTLMESAAPDVRLALRRLCGVADG